MDKEERLSMLREFFKSGLVKPMRIKELAGFLNVPKDERGELSALLDILRSEGLVSLDSSGRYGLSKARIVEGVFSTTGRGFGFVMVDGEKDDIFIPEEAKKGALQGDRVLCQVTKESFANKSKSPEGQIIKIIERGFTEVVGLYRKNGSFGFVLPDNQKFDKDIHIFNENSMGAVTGQKVVCKLLSYGDKNKKPEGQIVEILGNVNDPGVDILSLVRAYGIPEQFPAEVMDYVNNEITLSVSDEDKLGRRDLREVFTVTIDGEDAKDLDDAISVSFDGEVYRLGVHIADVTNYVREDNPLDKEARNRGTSVYLADRVIPMLPHKLCNGICSLNEKENRLALSCLMTIDKQGNIVEHEITTSVINVNHRMSYTQVNAIINNSDEEIVNKYKDDISFYKLANELSLILREKRFKRGAIDFNFPESKIVLDEVGKVKEIKPYERNRATELIEDFMLAANETVAEHFYWLEIPFVYRNHEEPDIEKMNELKVFVKNFGYNLHVGNEIYGKDIQKLLEAVKDSNWEAMIARLTLRSMKQAKYQPDCVGHFGLASKYYTHFTSPIRRYPDLIIHRIIKESLAGNLDEKRINHYNSIVGEIAQRCSVTERRAAECEREVDKLKKFEYMDQFPGEEYEGAISGITNYGMYVELPNTVEGMIRFSDIRNDYFEVSKNGYEVVAERSKKHYMLGQKIKVVYLGGSKILRTIDFGLVD